jgi:hypothetical protein
MMWRNFILVAAYIILAVASPGQSDIQAQGATCPAFIEQALDVLEDHCEALGRNAACYGFNRVDATFAQAIEPEFFSQPSDRAELTTLQSIRTAPLNLALERWGIAVMNVQANVPNTLPGQAVTFLLLGDTQVENRVLPDEAYLPPDPVTVNVRAGNSVNLRSGPGTANNIVGVASPGTVLLADALNDARDWVRVLYDDVPAWVSRSLVAAAGTDDLETLPLASAAAFTPMQAFYFTTGIGTPDCEEAPDTLVVQGPEQLSVDLQVNGAQFTIGSTIALTSPGDDAGTGAAPDFESPFGEEATDLLISVGFYIYPGGGDYVVIAGGAPTGSGLPLSDGLFLNPVDDQTVLLTTGPTETTGLDIAGGLYVDPPAPSVVTGVAPPDSFDGIAVHGRLYITPADGGVIVSITPLGDSPFLFQGYRRQSPGGEPILMPLDEIDPELLQNNPLYGVQVLNDRVPLLGGPSAPGNTPRCRLTEIVVLDGAARLNDGALIVPIGHAADTETCFAPDGEIESQSGWDNLRRLEQDELRRRFGLLEQIPPGLLRYPIRLPAPQDIDSALATPTPAPPVTQPDAPSAPQPQPPSTSLGVDCSGFRSTSPSDGLAFGPQQFFWDPAPGAERYRVVVRATDRPGQVIGETGAPATNLTLDLGLGALPQFGRGLNFEYVVQALVTVDGSLQVACESQVRFLNREFISPEQLCMLLGGQISPSTGECFGREGVITIPD